MRTLFTAVHAAVCAAALAMLGSHPANAQVTLDPSFVDQGRERISFDLDAAATDRAQRVFPTANGGFLLVGQASSGGNLNSLALTQLFPAGLDTSFGTEGLLTYGLGISPVMDIAQDAQGRLLVAILGFNGGGLDAYVLRLRADGSVDDSFGDNGITSFGFDQIDDWMSIASGPNSEVYALLRSRADIGDAWMMRVVALDASGNDLRSVFVSTLPDQGSGAIAWSPGRNALMLGYTSDGGGTCSLNLSQVRPRLVGGVPSLAVTSLTGLFLNGLSSSCTGARVNTVAAMGGSQGVLVAGHREDPASPGSGRQHGLMLRWVSTDDSTFGTIAPLPPADELLISAAAIDTRGRILTAGTVHNSTTGTRRFSLRRYLGTLGDDIGFNAGSPEITTSFLAGNGLESTQAIAADLRVVGARILVAGSVRFADPSDDDFAVAAFTTPDAIPVFQDGFEN